MNKFIRNLTNKGIVFDEALLRQKYNSLNPQIKQKAKIVLLPIAVSDSIVYGMNNINGSIVEFQYSRGSVGTYFDKDLNLQIAANNSPRIDYGNYSRQAKILIEKESTNLVKDSTNMVVRIQRSPDTSIIDFDWNGVLENNICGVLPPVTGSSGYFYNRINMTVDSIYTTSVFSSLDDDYPILRSGLIAGNLNYHGIFNYNTFTPLFVSDSPNIKYRANIGRYYSTSKANDTKEHGFGIAKTAGSIVKNTLVGGYQVEVGETMTSYIPTSGTAVTRSADIIKINLLTSARVYIKTTKEEKYLDKTAGVWNVQDDITESDGLLCLAVM